MSSFDQKPLFDSVPEVHTFAGLLFDMDGTIVDSTDAIVKHWHKLGKELGVDPEAILATSHGRRSIDTLQIYEPAKASWEYVSYVEGLIPKQFGGDAIEVAGARKLLASLEGAQWTIVTSGTRPLLEGWLEVLKLAHPRDVVTAEMVSLGKPNPECYMLGKERLHLSADSPTLVIEDSPSGIKAGKAANCRVIGLTTTHTIQQVKEAGADWIVEDLTSVVCVGMDSEGVQIEISKALTA